MKVAWRIIYISNILKIKTYIPVLRFRAEIFLCLSCHLITLTKSRNKSCPISIKFFAGVDNIS